MIHVRSSICDSVFELREPLRVDGDLIGCTVRIRPSLWQRVLRRPALVWGGEARASTLNGRTLPLRCPDGGAR